jgi:hypothetical protein
MEYTLEGINRRQPDCFHCGYEPMLQSESCPDCGERRDWTPLEAAEYMERFWKNSGSDLFRLSHENAKILRIARGEQEAWERDKMGKVFVPAYFGGYLDIAR